MRHFKAKSLPLRLFASLLFLSGGVYLVLSSLLGGPSFWYIPCFCALLPIGMLWAFRPSIAAALSIGPLVAVVALFRYVSGVQLGLLVAWLLAVLLLIINEFGVDSPRRLAIVCSLAFLALVIATDRLFTDKATVRSYQMVVALDGNAPWGKVGPEWADGTAPVVVYRRVGTSYCYDAFQSLELRNRLASKNGQNVEVQYNIFSDFGTERSYNVRSVDGLVLANGKNVVKDYERFGGQILGDATSSADTCR